MAYPRATVRQSDLTRDIKAVRAAGFDVALIEIDHLTGRVVIHTGQPDKEGANPCDRLLE